ncbi:MAG: hypothetical protein ACRDQ0_04190 [Pseudonocardia sp.]
MIRWVVRALGLSVACVALAATLTDGAAAEVPTYHCNDKSRESVVKIYHRGGVSVPLRCGTDTWGLNHIVSRGRWGDTFSAQIAQTIARGTVSRDGTVYAAFDDDCNEPFRIIVNSGALHGTEFAPQGIVTAYHISPGPQATAYPASSPAPDGQCLIVEPVNRTEERSSHGLDA